MDKLETWMEGEVFCVKIPVSLPREKRYDLISAAVRQAIEVLGPQPHMERWQQFPKEGYHVMRFERWNGPFMEYPDPGR